MMRKKVKLEYIENENVRRVTCHKRAKDIVKKTEELSVLCGVEACAIIYDPYEHASLVWPSSEEEVKRIVLTYHKNLNFDKSQRQLNQDTFLKKSMQKAQDRLMKLQRRNREIEMENLVTDLMTGRMTLEHVSPSNLGDLLSMLEDNLRSIQNRVRFIEGGKDKNIKNAFSPVIVDPTTGGIIKTIEGVNLVMFEGSDNVTN